MVPLPVSQTVSQSAVFANGNAEMRTDEIPFFFFFYLVDTRYNKEFHRSEMEALRSIMVSGLSAGNEIYSVFEEVFNRGRG